MLSSLMMIILLGLLAVGSSMDRKISKAAFKRAMRSGHGLLKRQIPSPCSTVYTKAPGTIHTQNYPRVYPNDYDCDWTIRAPSNQVIELTFDDPFDIEIPDNSGCDADVLEIFDGGVNAPLTAQFCSSVKPGPIVTLTNEAYLKFHSDFLLGYAGFSLRYRFLNSPDYPDVVTSSGSGSTDDTNGGAVVPGRRIILDGGTCQFFITPGQGCTLE